MISSQESKRHSLSISVSRGVEPSWRVSGGVPNGVPRGPIWGLLGYPPSEVVLRGLVVSLTDYIIPYYARLNMGIMMSRVPDTSRPPIWGLRLINLGGQNTQNHQF